MRDLPDRTFPHDVAAHVQAIYTFRSSKLWHRTTTGTDRMLCARSSHVSTCELETRIRRSCGPRSLSVLVTAGASDSRRTQPVSTVPNGTFLSNCSQNSAVAAQVFHAAHASPNCSSQLTPVPVSCRLDHKSCISSNWCSQAEVGHLRGTLQAPAATPCCWS